MIPQQTSPSGDVHVRNAAKLSNKISVELGAHVQQNSVCGLTRKGRFIGTTLDKGSEDVCNCENANEIRYLTPLEAVRITGSVKIFMMMKRSVDHFCRKPRHGCKRF
jgi:hypothetical protein